jgi:hypothetical protein
MMKQYATRRNQLTSVVCRAIALGNQFPTRDLDDPGIVWIRAVCAESTSRSLRLGRTAHPNASRGTRVRRKRSWHAGCLTGRVRWPVFVFSHVVVSALGLAGDPAPIEEIPFEFRDGLIHVRVEAVRSGESLNFLVDSGAEVSALNERTARELGLRGGNRVRVRGVEAATDGRWPVHLTARAGDLALPRNYLVLDLSDLSEACHCRIDGLIGADFFRNRVVELDFESRRIRRLNGSRISGSDAVLPMEVGVGAMRIPVGVDGGKARWARLDTGCASVLQWVTGRAPAVRPAATVAVGLAPVSIPETTATIQLGARIFPDLPIGLHATPIFPGEAGLVGNGLLSRFASVVIDARNRRIILRQRTLDP